MIMQKEKKKPGPKPFLPYTRDIEIFIKETYSQLSEREKRTYAAVEALKLSRGGKSYISKLIGCSRNTIIRGIEELKKPVEKNQNRIRGKGGGRKSAIETIENIDEVFLKVIDDHIAGDPMDAKIRWTNLSHKKIAQLKEQYLLDGNPVVSMDTKKKNF
jgi:hypothetical protein